MSGVLDAQNDIVTGEIDLYQNILCRHRLEQFIHIAVVGNVDAVADAGRPSRFNGVADVPTQILGWYKPQRQFSCM